jgi:hypothetical protein
MPAEVFLPVASSKPSSPIGFSPTDDFIKHSLKGALAGSVFTVVKYVNNKGGWFTSGNQMDFTPLASTVLASFFFSVSHTALSLLGDKINEYTNDCLKAMKFRKTIVIPSELLSVIGATVFTSEASTRFGYPMPIAEAYVTSYVCPRILGGVIQDFATKL